MTNKLYVNFQERDKLEQENAEKAFVKILQVIKLLNMEPVENSEGYIQYRRIRVKAVSGNMTIYFDCSDYTNWRIIIAGNFPRYKNQYIEVYDENNKKIPSIQITVSSEKTPDKIVNDIQSRFFPEYERKLIATLKRIAEYTENDNTKENILRQLKEEDLSDHEKETSRISLYHKFKRLGEFKVYVNSVDFSVSSLTLEQALQIKDLLKTFTKSEE
jgi:hypothetical protein